MEVDEVSRLCAEVMSVCGLKLDGCYKSDIFGEPTYEEFHGHFIQTGVICRNCWDNILKNWMKVK